MRRSRQIANGTANDGIRLRVVVAGLLTALTCIGETPADDKRINEHAEDCVFRARVDGTEQRYVVLTPPTFSVDRSTSILIALHGHGSDRWQFIRQARGECRATRDIAAAHRMVLVSPDYRATTSWMGPNAEADMVQLVEILKARFKVKRVVLSGGSMGGTGALTFTALHPELIDGVVSLNGTANLVEYERFQDAMAESFGGPKTQFPDEYRKRSAEFFPERFTMPFAVTTGGEDTVVPAASVLRLVDLLREHNHDVLSIHQPNGGHSTTYDDTKRAFEFVLSAIAASAHDERAKE